MKVLVTGGAGFIGSHIVDLLISEAHEVAVVDNLSSGRRDNINRRAPFFDLDITNLYTLRIAFSNWKPDVVTHQAAQPSLRHSLESPGEDAEINIIGTLNVIEACRQFGVKHLVFASTGAVYDPAGLPPFLEDDPLSPNLPYGIAKMAAERYVRTLFPSSTVLRYGNVYGPRQVPVGENQLIPHALDHMLHGKPFVINGDGQQSRDFVYVKDIARANLIAMEKRASGTFNAGNGIGHSVNRVVSELKEITNYAGEIAHGPQKAGEARHAALNSKKLSAYGWQPETSLYDGLRLTAGERVVA